MGTRVAKDSSDMTYSGTLYDFKRGKMVDKNKRTNGLHQLSVDAKNSAGHSSTNSLLYRP